MDFFQNNFSFMLQTDLRFGIGVANNLPQYLRDFEWKDIALVIDSGVAQNPAWQRIQTELENDFKVVAQLETGVTEPTYGYLDQVKNDFMNKHIDGFIVAGGGSVLDIGKALSVLLSNPGPAINYRGFNLIKTPGPPLIAIPTTAGTASEVTPNAVFIDTDENRKFGINTALYIPKLCLLDPALTASCPRSVTISSGMDALVHAHESFVSKRATPITRPLSVAAFKLVFNALGDVVNRPEDLELRARVQLGSYLAGIALFNSSAGPAGAMSYPLGVHQRVPHGLAGAVFLPRIIQHNIDHGYAGYRELYETMNGSPAFDDEHASQLFCERVWQFCDQLEIPRSLDRFGFTRASIPQFLKQAKLLRGAFDMNPVEFSDDDVRQTLEDMTSL
jgi:alcohol dehydrogenase